MSFGSATNLQYEVDIKIIVWNRASKRQVSVETHSKGFAVYQDLAYCQCETESYQERKT